MHVPVTRWVQKKGWFPSRPKQERIRVSKPNNQDNTVKSINQSNHLIDQSMNEFDRTPEEPPENGTCCPGKLASYHAAVEIWGSFTNLPNSFQICWRMWMSCVYVWLVLLWFISAFLPWSLHDHVFTRCATIATLIAQKVKGAQDLTWGLRTKSRSVPVFPVA